MKKDWDLKPTAYDGVVLSHNQIDSLREDGLRPITKKEALHYLTNMQRDDLYKNDDQVWVCKGSLLKEYGRTDVEDNAVVIIDDVMALELMEILELPYMTRLSFDGHKVCVASPCVIERDGVPTPKPAATSNVVQLKHAVG